MVVVAGRVVDGVVTGVVVTLQVEDALVSRELVV